jgi:2-methylcitrate dehydratase PrpD
LPPYELHTSEEVLNLASKVSIHYDPDLEVLYPEKRPSQVIIKTNKGHFKHIVYLPQGEPEKPFNWDDLVVKFRTLNPKFDVDTLDIIKKMESCDVSYLMNILSNHKNMKV